MAVIMCSTVPFLQADTQERGDVPVNKILVAYASKYGSTAGVAEAVAKSLREAGAAVDVANVQDVKSVKEYTAVVVGSGVYMGKWKSDAIKFLKKNKADLNTKPVAFFQVCLQVKENTPENHQKAEKFFKKAKETITPIDTISFAGALTYSKLGFFMRTMLKMAKTPEADSRDWPAIAAWSKKVYPLLTK